MHLKLGLIKQNRASGGSILLVLRLPMKDKKHVYEVSHRKAQ